MSVFDSPEDARTMMVQLARSEAEVSCAESAITFADARIKALDASLATLKAVAYQVGILRPPVFTERSVVEVPKIDEVTQARARRALMKSGYVRVR